MGVFSNSFTSSFFPALYPGLFFQPFVHLIKKCMGDQEESKQRFALPDD